MANIFQIYKNSVHGFKRVLIGITLKDDHTCFYHTTPSSVVVYTFTDTNYRRFAEAEWCEMQTKENNYIATKHKVNPLSLSQN